MNIFSTRKKRICALASAAIIVAVGSGVAYAYWTGSGKGSGTATTGTSSTLVVASTAGTGGPLSPGGPTETVAFTVTNGGTGHQKLSSVVVSVANPDGTPWTAVTGCSSADYTVGIPVITYSTLGPSAVASGTVTVAMNNLATNQDGCKLAVVPLYFVAS